MLEQLREKKSLRELIIAQHSAVKEEEEGGR